MKRCLAFLMVVALPQFADAQRIRLDDLQRAAQALQNGGVNLPPQFGQPGNIRIGGGQGRQEDDRPGTYKFRRAPNSSGDHNTGRFDPEHVIFDSDGFTQCDHCFPAYLNSPKNPGTVANGAVSNGNFVWAMATFLGDDITANDDALQQPFAERANYALDLLLAYADALGGVRASGVINHDAFMNGM